MPPEEVEHRRPLARGEEHPVVDPRAAHAAVGVEGLYEPMGLIRLSVQPVPAGMSEIVGPPDSDDDDDAAAAAQPATVMAQVYAMKSGVHGNAMWTVERAKPATAAVKKPGDDDLLKSALANRFGADSSKEQLERFWETFAKLFEPGISACDPYQCSLTGTVPQPRKK